MGSIWARPNYCPLPSLVKIGRRNKIKGIRAEVNENKATKARGRDPSPMRFSSAGLSLAPLGFFFLM